MALLKLESMGGALTFDQAQCREAGQRLRTRYAEAAPFPHIAVDNFIEASVLHKVLSEYPSSEGRSYYNDGQTRLKYAYGIEDIHSAFIRNLLYELNGKAFLSFLEEMTGIEGLISDSSYEGGGLHETKNGGRLAVHADFTLHKTLKVERRLNLLIYLNEDWRSDYHGELELWDSGMKACEVRIAPLLGRAVVFSTTRNSYHGQPNPLTCPPDRSRKSIAIYYYTAAESGLVAVPDRLTNFKVRPGSDDKPVPGLWKEHLIRDWVPPRIAQMIHRKI